MELYVALMAALFVWAGAVFFVIGYNDWNDLVGVFVTLVGYVVLTESLGFTVAPPTSGEPIGRLLEFTFASFGLIGVAALVAGALIGRYAGASQRHRS